MTLRIITDSASDLPKKWAEELGIEVIPTPVVVEGTDYLDGETLQPKELYNMLRAGKDVKTYHINSYMFCRHFEPYAKREDKLIYICFSTGIAGTFNAANLAKKELLEKYPEFDLTILDSKCASAGMGAVAYMAGRMCAAGAEKELIIEAIEFHCSHMRMIFTVETLEYLYKGGRLGRTAAAAGTFLQIKPIIEVDREGKLTVLEKVRGRKHSLKRLVELACSQGKDHKNQMIGTVHGDAEDVVREIQEELKLQCGAEEFLENYVGCAIGAHTGPGIIGITFLDAVSPYQKYYR